MSGSTRGDISEDDLYVKAQQYRLRENETGTEDVDGDNRKGEARESTDEGNSGGLGQKGSDMMMEEVTTGLDAKYTCTVM